MTERRYSDLELYRRLLTQARPYWPHIFGLFLLSLLSTPLALLSPLPIKIVVDSVLGPHPLPGFLQALVPAGMVDTESALLVFAVFLLVAVTALTQIQNLANSLLDTYVGQRLVLAFRARLFRHVQRMSLLYHDMRGTHDTIYRILYDAPAIQWIAIHGVIPFVSAGLMFSGMIYVIARIDGQLALIALLISPFLFLLTGFSRDRLRKQWKEAKQRESSAASVVQEVMGAVRVVKAFGQEQREHERFIRHGREGVNAHVRVMKSEGLYGFATGVLLATGSAAVLFFGARNVIAGTLTLGDLILVMSYLGQLYGPLKSIGTTLVNVQNSLASAERAFDLLDEKPEVVERPNARRLDRARGEIRFEGVEFAYVENQPVLKEIDFLVEPGSLVGIVGKTGAGKTTLISLLVRLYDPTAGRILLDDVDLRDYKLKDLRNQFAMVLQEPVLFSTSIGENIAYARPDATDSEIRAAARAANAEEFISNLSDGFDTLVGERGMRLSGGERQRVALARAFLLDAPILILDEPTSSVDVGTEEGILEALDRLRQGRTVFMIAHRLRTLEGCGMLLRLEEGRLTRIDQDIPDVLHQTATV